MTRSDCRECGGRQHICAGAPHPLDSLPLSSQYIDVWAWMVVGESGGR
jgi:hypothetical protein